MKLLKFIPLLGLFALTACSSIQVSTDYDSSVNFSQFKTYAFMKSGIDDSPISELDKKRILKAVEAELNTKGYTKSDNPQLLVNIFTESQQNVNINTYYGSWGYRPWGWNPWMYGPGYSSVSVNTEGILFIDILKAENKELIWQGKGSGYLTSNKNKKEQKIKEFAQKILSELPQ